MPIYNQVTKTSDAIQKPQKMYQPRQKYESSRVTGATTRVQDTATRVTETHKIDTKIIKKFGKHTYRGQVMILILLQQE